LDAKRAGSYLRRVKRSFGNPYYGSYYASQYYYDYWNYLCVPKTSSVLI
jgi:hypothetical protein